MNVHILFNLILVILAFQIYKFLPILNTYVDFTYTNKLIVDIIKYLILIITVSIITTVKTLFYTRNDFDTFRLFKIQMAAKSVFYLILFDELY